MTAAPAGAPQRHREDRGRARSCEYCFAWGLLRQRLCRACESYTRSNPAGLCQTCRRQDIPIRGGACRLCRKQASLIAGPRYPSALDLSVAAKTGQQLFFADMLRALRLKSPRLTPTPPANAARPALPINPRYRPGPSEMLPRGLRNCCATRRETADTPAH